MIDLYCWMTPNVHKVLLFLEETQLPYRLLPVDIGNGDQFSDSFSRISPNNRIPAIIDRDPNIEGGELALFESGAILQYLARKTGKFHGRCESEALEVDQWLFWQMAGLGPMVGQNHHFHHYAEGANDYAKTRYMDETRRLYRVLDRRLHGRSYVACDAYTIADMACYPWIKLHQRSGQNIEDFPFLERWLHRIAVRPATIRCYEQPLGSRKVNLAPDRTYPA